MDVVTILQHLIHHKSENPPGNEAGVAMYVHSLLDEHGIDVQMAPVKKGRPNLYARLKGEQPGPTLIYNGHLDVVPAGSNWSYPPFEGQVKANRIYGRGAADMKSGVAAMIQAAITLKKMGNPFAGELVLFFNVDEERTNLGMYQFLEEDIQADYAIYKMAKMIGELEELGTEIRTRTDPFMGPSSLTVSQIKGGTAPNIVPDQCQIEIDRRTLPGETKEEVQAEIEESLNNIARQNGFDFELDNYLFLPASYISPEHHFVQQLQQVSAKICHSERDVRVFEATCEAPFFSVEKGIPTIIFGPGGLEQAHIADEYVEIEEVVQAADIFIQLVQSLLSYESKG